MRRWAESLAGSESADNPNNRKAAEQTCLRRAGTLFTVL